MLHVDAVSNSADWNRLHTIVVPRTRQILRILREHRTRATFFVLGWIAERYPHLVRMIAAEGHEIGTHSFWHRPVYEMDRHQFRDDLRASIDAIRDCSGVEVKGFRAPSFSIIPGYEWALDVIADQGILYDASLFPARRSHGGYACKLGPHWIKTPAGRYLCELPMSIAAVACARICFSGGGYLRLLPLWFIEYGVRQAEHQGRPAVVYLHPRDFAVDCPTVRMPIRRRFRSRVGLHTTEPKLRSLLQRHVFTTCEAVLEYYLGSTLGNNRRAA